MANAKPGDWMCPACGDHQFARNMMCRKCGAAKPDDGTGGGCGNEQAAWAGAGGGCMGGGFAGAGGGCMGGGMGGGPGGMKPGDWMCPACGDHQFAKNMACRKCGTPNPSGGDMAAAGGMMAGGMGGGPGGMKPGDWMCSQCGDHQFAKNFACRKCGAPKPDDGTGGMAALGGCGGGAGFGGGAETGNMKPGDWFCQQCGDLQFAKNQACRKCGAPHPMMGGGMMGGGMMGGGANMMAMMGGGGAMGGNMKPGDWLCSQCGDHQYARNPACRKCGAPKPEDGGQAAAMGGGCGMMAMMNPNFKQGDWMCSACGNHVFARNEACPKCGASKAEAAAADASGGMMGGMMGGMKFLGGSGPMPKPGDWNCPACGDHQFARNEVCRKCGGPRPEGAGVAASAAMQEGDWMCPACGDHQFARNATCRKCGTAKPTDQVTGRERSRSPQRQAAQQFGAQQFGAQQFGAQQFGF